MIRLNCEIRIGNYKFTYVNNVVIRKSYDTYTDTAVITMPNKFKDTNDNILEIFNVGDEIEIKLGYYPELITRFKGYLTKKLPGSPAVFECQDEAWKLKKQGLSNYSKLGISLETLISDNYSGTYEVEDVEVGDWQIQKSSTLIDVFEKLKDLYGLFSYFEDETLKVKFKTSIINETINKLSYQYNIIDGNLQYTEGKDVDAVSYYASKQDDGTLLESFAYYDSDNVIKISTTNPGGTLNKFSIPNQTQSNLNTLAAQRLPNLYYTGTSGSITAFGKPIFNIGDKLQLIDEKYTERNGIFAVKSIVDDFGINGYRQIIEPDTELT